MRKHITAYYLLFVLLIMGCFASMAQNHYGVQIMGLVGVGFSTLFLVQLYSLFVNKNAKSWLFFIELTSLSAISIILTLRIFLIHFQFVEILFVVAGSLLVFFYSNRLFQHWKKLDGENKMLARLTSLFYGSIIFYMLSMITVPFFPFLAEPFGGFGFFLLLMFLAFGIKKSNIMQDGDKISAIDYVLKFKDRSVVLIFLFLSFTAYMGLTKIEILPKMYSDEYPQAYFELVNRAESGKEEPENGTFKHQEFKEAYNRFVEGSLESE